MYYAIRNTKDRCLMLTYEDRAWCVFDTKSAADRFYRGIPEDQKSSCEVVPVEVTVKVKD